MIATEAPLSVDSAAEKVMSLLGNDEPEPQVTEQVETTEQPEPEGVEPEVTQEAEAEPEAPAIEPPVSWKADAKEKFKALPRELQEYVATRESERDSHFGKTQQEVAEARKAAEAERQAIQQERQSYSQRLTQLIESAQLQDPILAEGARTDWVKASQDDPIGTQQKWFAYQQRLGQLQTMQQQRDTIQAQIRMEQVKQSEAKLAEYLKDEWTNPDKRTTFQSEVRKVLTEAGYTPQDFEGITDFRALKIAHKAALYDKLMAQQTQLADKKVKPSAPKTVLKSQAVDSGDKSDRMKAAIQRASKSSRLEDIAAAIAPALD